MSNGLEKEKLMILKMKLIVLALSVMLLPSCGLKDWQKDVNEELNRSALYDPITVTLIPGLNYSFVEGNLKGTGQKYHSDYSYRRALIIGSDKE